jgi:hypothetical protein
VLPLIVHNYLDQLNNRKILKHTAHNKFYCLVNYLIVVAAIRFTVFPDIKCF